MNDPQENSYQTSNLEYVALLLCDIPTQADVAQTNAIH